MKPVPKTKLPGNARESRIAFPIAPALLAASHRPARLSCVKPLFQAFTMPAPSPLPGTYLITLKNTASRRITIGRKGTFLFPPGYYCYVGSALGPGGVLSRVRRHCNISKRKHWHIDFLREVATPVAVWFTHATIRHEHHWADALSRLSKAQAVEGFGCTDCTCLAHLYCFPNPPSLEEFALVANCAVSACQCGELG